MDASDSLQTEPNQNTEKPNEINGGAEFIDHLRLATPQLRIMIEYHKRNLPVDQYTNLLNDIRAMHDKFSSSLAGYHPGAERAREAHRLINVAIDQSTQVKASCKKGCGACCSLEVEITHDEGALLAQIVESGVQIDRPRLELQAKRERQGIEWKNSGDLSNRCVFLGPDQNCRIYESRPAICRKVVVASDPKECNNPEGKPQPILIPMAEIALTAALNQPGNTNLSLSKSLLAALGSSTNCEISAAESTAVLSF